MEAVASVIEALNVAGVSDTRIAQLTKTERRR